MADAQFKQRIEDALENQTLRGALGRFVDTYSDARDKAYEGYDVEAMRDQVAQVKSYAAEHLDEMINKFEKAATARGAKVYRAKTGEDARQYILELAKKQNAHNIVKSKSMASEEIHLNQTLIDAGMDVQETDLGEWIVQMAGQRPSHMVMPAIHLTKEDVADEFTKNLHYHNDPVISKLVKTARAEMRKKFMDADMGISGANIAVAETGTLMMVTNEGNACLTATWPKTHVFLVGIEKFVNNFEDASSILQMLPRNGTCQQITSYVTMVTGQTPAYYPDGTIDGKEFHIVLMDNRRRKMYEDEKFKKTFQCIRCAACLNVCPAFQLVGGHVFGDIYTGGIGVVLTNFLNPEDESTNPQNLCIQCGRCNEVCAGRLNISEMILEIRNRIGEKTGLPFVQKFALDVVSNRRLFHSLLKIASKAQLPFSKGQPMIRHLPMFLSGLTKNGSLPTVADVPFRDVIKTINQDIKDQKGTIAFFGGCLVDFVYPHIGEGVVRGLNEKGYKVTFPEGQSCCGAPASYMGDRQNARKSAIINIEAMNAEEVDYVVSACPTCTHALKDSFRDLLADDPAMLKRAEELNRKTFDFSKLLYDLGGLEPGGDGKNVKVTYHDSCHLKRKMGVYKEQREILTNIKGVNLVEMKDSDRCCGFGGSYAIKFPEMAGPILEKKLNNIKNTGAEVVAVDCPGCLMQITGGLDKLNSPVKVKHTAEIILEKWAK